MTKKESEHLPPWYYGYAYRDWAYDYTVFYPIPLNFLIRLVKLTSIHWNKFRAKATWFDIEMQKQYTKSWDHGYKQGRIKGRQEGCDEMAQALSLKKKEFDEYVKLQKGIRFLRGEDLNQ